MSQPKQLKRVRKLKHRLQKAKALKPNQPKRQPQPLKTVQQLQTREMIYFPGVMFYEEAVTRCIADDIEWGERCDEETGLLKLPTSIPPACFAPFEGDNGGATERGVTEDTINIVYWRWMENDFILQYITGPIANDDSNADAEESSPKKCSNTTKRTTRLTEEK